MATRLEGTSTAEGPTNLAEEVACSYLKKLDVAFVEANDDIQRGLMGREVMYSALLTAASELQKVLAQAAEYEQLAKSARRREAELLEQENTHSQHLNSCNDAVNSQRVSADNLEKHIAEMKALVEQAVEKRGDQDQSKCTYLGARPQASAVPRRPHSSLSQG